MPLSIEKNAPKCTTLEPSRSKGLTKSVKKFAMAGLSRNFDAPQKNAPLLQILESSKPLDFTSFKAFLAFSILHTFVPPRSKLVHFLYTASEMHHEKFALKCTIFLKSLILSDFLVHTFVQSGA